MAALCLQFLKANGKDSISKNSKGAFEFAAVEDGQSGDGPPSANFLGREIRFSVRGQAAG